MGERSKANSCVAIERGMVVVVANGAKKLSKFGEKSDVEVVPLFIFNSRALREIGFT